MSPHMDAGAERLLEESLERQAHSLDRRERIGTLFFAGTFIVAATAFALAAEADRPFSPALAAAFVIALAMVARVELWGGAGTFLPTQIVFVPMLLLLPTPLVPLLVAAGLVLAKASRALQDGRSLGRSTLALADSWFSLGPALILVALGAQLPELGDWPAYVAALSAQIVTDATIFLAFIWACQGVRPARP